VELPGRPCFCQTLVVGYKYQPTKRTKMVYKTLASKLADDLVELHNVGGIELEHWDTAYEFVKIYYNTEEMVQIVIREKKV
jgi:hypothetical protein